MPVPTLSQVWFWAFTVLCAGFGAYLGSYLRKKGENVATKEDFDDLKKQTAELTLATKEIENRISNDAWDRQQQRQLKRDLLYDVVLQARVFRDLFLRSCLTGPQAKIGPSEAEWAKWKSESEHNEAELKKIYYKIADLTLFSRVIGSRALISEMETFYGFANEALNISMIGKASFELWKSHFEHEFEKRNEELIKHVRQELRIAAESQ